ncbi:hypothetical protein Pla123a_11030 [Posidoniimonas polymericola]|uniref:Carboxypeptidase regulatory-like domain-containing protein n=1 Tax=Posidoniimonas polymericola TaxID=2528002 RepID=A0A5C5YTI2_9BACT|nr:hypothetical protein [Posidoniimonas polymericola]TWT78312.1 hypothetical protein Pla123a_11030 [Posidoniimonas polymericola]
MAATTKTRYRLVLAWLPMLLAGCAEPPTAIPSGAVTANGQPVELGTIMFAPTESGTTPEGVKRKPVSAGIDQGRYSVTVTQKMPPGDYKVIVIGQRRTGRKLSPEPGAPATEDELVDFLPPKFNTQTQLVETIGEGESTVDFNLEF